MGAFCFWTKSEGNSHQFSYIFCKTEPLGIELKDVVFFLWVHDLFLDIQRKIRHKGDQFPSGYLGNDRIYEEVGRRNEGFRSEESKSFYQGFIFYFWKLVFLEEFSGSFDGYWC